MEEFDAIYSKYLKEVFQFLLKLSRNPDIAEELTQETFSIAFQKLDRFRGTCKISVWLCQIAKHEYYAYYKAHKKYVSVDDVQEIQASKDVEQEVLLKMDSIRIHEVLHGLSEPYKEVFTLRVMGELSYQDISGLFRKSPSWARVTYYRAKAMIQERLRGDEYDEL